jgi:hypothetical protein
MMKIPVIFIAMQVLFGSCQGDWNTSMVDDEMIEYKLQPGQYAVVVIISDQVTLERAKKAARQRAAEVAVSGGYRFFLIQSETQTRVVRQRASLENDIEEMFIEGDFGRGQLAASSMKEAAFSALKVVFQCFDTKPEGKSINACNLTDCSSLDKGSENP